MDFFLIGKEKKDNLIWTLLRLFIYLEGKKTKMV